MISLTEVILVSSICLHILFHFSLLKMCSQLDEEEKQENAYPGIICQVEKAVNESWNKSFWFTLRSQASTLSNILTASTLHTVPEFCFTGQLEVSAPSRYACTKLIARKKGRHTLRDGSVPGRWQKIRKEEQNFQQLSNSQPLDSSCECMMLCQCSGKKYIQPTRTPESN